MRLASPAWFFRRALVLFIGAAMLSPRAHADPPATLRFALSAGVNTSVQPALYARAKGLFAKHDLDVSFIAMNDDPTAVQGLIADQYDLVYVGAAPGIVAISRGADIRMICSFNPLSDSSFLAQDRFTTLKQMEGQVVGVAKIGSLSYIATLAVFQKEGIDPSKVSFLAAGNDAAKAQLMAAGRIAGTTLNGIYAAPILGPTSKVHVIYDVGAALADSMLNTAVFARGALARDHPEVLEHAVEALIEASRALQSDETLAIDQAVSSGLPREAARSTYDHLFAGRLKYYGVDGGVSRAIVASTIRLLKDNDVVETAPSVDAVLDTRFTEAALAALGPYRP